MSSQGRQPCLALELPTKSWPQIPWRADQPSISIQKFPSRSGMVAGFWVWIFGGFHENARFYGLAPSGKIRAQNPHTKLNKPRHNPCQKSAPKSGPKIHTKICTQKPHQNLRPSSQPRPTEPTMKMPPGESLELHFVATRTGLRKSKNSDQKSVTRFRGRPDGNKVHGEVENFKVLTFVEKVDQKQNNNKTITTTKIQQ